MTLTWRASGFLLAGFVAAAVTGWAQPPSPLEKYRTLEFPPVVENFDKGWKDRVALEYEIINAADLKSLRAALKDDNAFVRSMAARALGILGDKASADALADLVQSDPEYMVRIRAVDALGFLKMRPEAIELAKKDRDAGVQWAARIAAGHAQVDWDDAAHVRRAFAAGIRREAMGSAQVGKPAPDFTAQTSDGKPFRLSSVLGKKPIAIYFAAFEG
ncbi:MAG: HEAT repeat domain-containing protein [Gemmataceae bacterium]|nr:HEAT repeat domain-containing protein [Gemmataceae bacterium]